MNQTIRKRIEDINNGIVPEGYKQTSFGIFPSDWETNKKLNDLGIFDKGKGLPGDKMTDEGVPCIGYGDIYMKYNYHFEKAQNFVDEKTASESQPIEKGTLLFTGTGETAEEIGKCVCYNGDETIYAGGDIILFNSKEVNPLFLAYQQYQDFSLKRKAMFGQGHSVVHIQRGELAKLYTAFPKDKAEQGKIAEILMKWDEMVELQEQYIQKLELRKKAIMKKLLTPKDGWENYKLFELVVSMSSGGTPSTKKQEYYDGNIVWVSIDDMSRAGKYIADSARKLTDLGLKNSSAKLFPEQTILYAMYASIGKTVISTVPCTTSQAILGIIVNQEKLDNQYLYYYLLNMQDKIVLQGQKGTQSNLNKEMVEKFDISLPKDLDEQKKISKILMSVDEEISLQKEKLAKIKEERKAMQQYLLTGIVRVG